MRKIFGSICLLLLPLFANSQQFSAGIHVGPTLPLFDFNEFSATPNGFKYQQKPGVAIGLSLEYLGKKNWGFQSGAYLQVGNYDFVLDNPFPKDEIDFTLTHYQDVSQASFPLNLLYSTSIFHQQANLTLFGGPNINLTYLGGYLDHPRWRKIKNDDIGIGVLYEMKEDWKTYLSAGLNLGARISPSKRFHWLSFGFMYNCQFSKANGFTEWVTYDSPYSTKEYRYAFNIRYQPNFLTGFLRINLFTIPSWKKTHAPKPDQN